ncbi:uncharacterized protein LOC144902382 [Branchiostoma floridae x Branchiostoma belcheri]
MYRLVVYVAMYCREFTIPALYSRGLVASLFLAGIFFYSPARTSWGSSEDVIHKIKTVWPNITLGNVPPLPAAGGSGGTVYTRWGKTTCPNGVTLLYEGIAGGSHWTLAGGANYVCLPKNPEWGNFKSGNQGNSYIFGAEYQVSFSNPFQTQGLHDHDVPCAVCHVATRGAQVMIPARLSCPSGWTREYKGYLMAERFNHKRSEFVCVDEQPEVRPSGHANVDGALFYPVDARCGSLPCPPYVEGRELTCVVCTK